MVHAADWNEVSGQPAPSWVAMSASATAPDRLPFIPDRIKEMRFWQAYSDPKIIAKIAESMTKVDALGWEDTGLWMHLRGSDGKWTSLPICQMSRGAQGGVKAAGSVFTIHPKLWKNLQSTRPAATANPAAGLAVKPKTGSFTVSLGEMQGTAQSVDDRKLNPFLKYDGDAAKEEACVTVPDTYDGSEPYGLMVFISPGMDGNNQLPGGWSKDMAARKLIWIGAKNGGNNFPGDRRVWLAQQARAWALHHYQIAPTRMVISGFSNGADAASATAVATPFGFNNAILFAPPCNPPLDAVVVPQEKDAKGSQVVLIKPLSSSGISHIKKDWRIAYVCGTNDSFLKGVRRSAEIVKVCEMGSKLFEINGLGHGIPSEIGDVLDFILAPRVATTKGGTNSFQAAPALAAIRSNLTTNPAKAKELMTQLWNNHPEAHSDADLIALLAEMETLP